MKPLRGLWRHFSYNYEQGGLRQILSKLLYRARCWAFREDRWWIYERTLTTEHLDLDQGMEWREFRAEDLRRLGYFKIQQFPEMIERRLKQGAICHGLLLDGRLANLGWTQLGELELDSGAVLRDPTMGAIFDCYTVPEYRGRGLYPKSLIGMMQKLREAGAKKAWIGVDPDNLASIRGIEKAGFGERFLFLRRRVVGLTRFKRDSGS
jgi:hypothetical protein